MSTEYQTDMMPNSAVLEHVHAARAVDFVVWKRLGASPPAEAPSDMAHNTSVLERGTAARPGGLRAVDFVVCKRLGASPPAEAPSDMAQNANGLERGTAAQPGGSRRSAFIALIIACIQLACCLPRVLAQSTQTDLPPGFQRISGRYIDLITDMPLNDDLRELPSVFDAAIPIWCAAFDVPQAEAAQWRVEAFFMRARERFLSAGLLPGELPQFPYGFQWGDRLWVAEQQSEYYHRHLLLHEGTHWFMNRKYGNNGPPWLMEGLAEWYGTHRWDGTHLQMGIIPNSKQDVPGWGRISLIQEQLESGIAPSLETIMRYDGRAHQQADAYAWSWAIVLFFMHHPDTRDTFTAMFKQTMQSDATLSRWFFKRLSSQWPQLRQSWNIVLAELEYGFDPSRAMPSFTLGARALDAQSHTLQVAADQSWQASGLVIPSPTRLRIMAAGEYFVGNIPKPWRCGPEGVTLEYFRGQPLGKLMMIVVDPLSKEPNFAHSPNPIAVGSGGEFMIRDSGELFFRINETSGGLSDNSGTLSIQVAR